MSNWVTDDVAITDQVEGRALVGTDGLAVICVGHHGFNYRSDAFFLMDPPVPASLLDAVAATIESYLQQGRRVVVHCGEGVERSPLSVAWWMHKRWEIPLEQAYQRVFQSRTQAADRRDWIVYE